MFAKSQYIASQTCDPMVLHNQTDVAIVTCVNPSLWRIWYRKSVLLAPDLLLFLVAVLLQLTLTSPPLPPRPSPALKAHTGSVGRSSGAGAWHSGAGLGIGTHRGCNYQARAERGLLTN